MKQTFAFKQFAVRQDRCAMKVGTDGVLLGAWARVEHCRRILDVGTGTGLVALMAAQRSSADVVAIDLDAAAVVQARENVAASPWPDRIQVFEADAREIEVRSCHPEQSEGSRNVQYASAEADSEMLHFIQHDTESCNGGFSSFDALLCNPPFFENSLKSPDAARSMARHTDTLSFDKLARSASHLLSPEGELSVVIPYDRAHDMTVSCACHGLFATRQTIVVPVEGGKPKRILMAFTREGASHSIEMLHIQDAQRQYTPEYIRLVKEFYLNM